SLSSFAEDPSSSITPVTATPVQLNSTLLQSLPDIKSSLPEAAASVVDNVKGAANLDLGSLTSLKTSISAESKAKTEELLAEINSSLFSIESQLALFPNSQKQLTLIKGSIQTYFTSKKTMCASSAETAGFLCAEGTSPGAKSVKMLMDVGAPVLSVISSAQKACSTTAKITSFASTALTVAKGLCVATKATCDIACSSASTQLGLIGTQINAFQGIFLTEGSKLLADCVATVGATCTPIETANQVVPPSIGKIGTSLKVEATPVSGTATNIAVKCTGYSKDIALMAVNLASLLAAKKGADACSDSLKSTASTGTTPLQYCETPSNTNTQYCICLKDNTKVGCPGYAATATTTTTAATSENGVDVKSTGSGNQFASGSVSTKPTSALGSVGGLGTTAATDANKAAATTTANGLTAAGSGSGGGASDASGAPSADLGSAKDAKAAAEKKWGFGSFSGIGGGGSGGGSSSGSASNNKLGQKDMDALKRQIASEQLRAEVSEASGKSNWEKVRERYLMNSSSLLSGK
ncbi:MAG: hypothetical protein H7256_15205, partial [Bdellovibrio sp.]|nr:hypothetical protein [Bdellovibrio sp.]